MSGEFFEEEKSALKQNPKKSHTQSEAANGLSLARYLANKERLNNYFEKKLEQERSRLIDRYFGKDSPSNVFKKFMVRKSSAKDPTVAK